MRRIRQHGTAAELAVRRIASSLHLRYTIRNKDLPGSPDLANRKRHFAIFVHGCFWHRHSHCRRTTTPKSNRTFWMHKFAQNQARDFAVTTALRALAFRVIIVWECEVGNLALVKRRLRVLDGNTKLDQSFDS